MGTTYDEELTPATDPPLIDPPPTATLLGRIFAHRRDRRTVVQAPLVPVEQVDPVDEPDMPVEPDEAAVPQPEPEPVPVVAEPAPEAVVPEPAPEAVVPEPAPAAVVTEPAPAPAAVVPPAAEPPPRPQPVRVAPEPVAPVPARATRYCPMCGERVPIDADGLHCHLGHALSPAHAVRKQRGLLGRLLRR